MPGLFQSIFMPHSTPKTPSAPAPAAGAAGAAAAAPSAKSTVTGAGVAPGTDASDFTKNQQAYWQQLLQGTGQTAGGALPEGIQSNIDKQASLIG